MSKNSMEEMSSEVSPSFSSANKKRKLQPELEEVSKRKASTDEIDPNLNSMNVVPILADEFFKAIETEKMYVGKITEKKETSRLIKEFSLAWPCKSHLKRVRWTAQKGIFEILICPVLGDNVNSLESSYPLKHALGEHPINTHGLEEEVTVIEVAKFAPATNSQYRDAMQFWPVQFRENKYVEKVLSGKLFDSEEKKSIHNFLKIATNAAKHGDEKVGCVIVDPVSSEIVAVAHDRRQHHPTQHAIMVATDLVAKSQGGGSWDIDSKHVYYKPYSKEEADKKISELKKLNPDKDVKKLSLPYLCTGYDAYISREPCIMCAMALVHSRIRRVFYSSKVSWGALGSHCKLHLQEGLNHHYEVFQVESEALSEVEKNDSMDNSIS